MKGCNSQNPQELGNLVRNKKALYNISSKQTQDETANFLGHTTDNFAKHEQQYKTKDLTASLATTITTRISDNYKKKNGDDFVFDQLDLYAAVGTFVHSLGEESLNYLVDATKDMTTDETLAFAGSLTWANVGKEIKAKMAPIAKDSGFTILTALSDAERNNLEAIFEGFKDVFVQINNKQRAINRRLNTNGKVKIFTEQILIDPKNDIGGTADVIALYSDNTAAVFDFKTKIPAKQYTDSSGNIITTDYITYHHKEKYKAQLGTIQKILISQYGVKQVVQSRIVPIQVNMGVDTDTGKYNNTITRVVVGAKQNPNLVQYAPLPELTGFKDLDEFLTDIEKRIKIYETKIKNNSKDKDYYKKKLEELQHAKQSILVKHSFNDLIKYGEELLKSIEGSKISDLDIEQLRDLKDELKSLTVLSRVTEEYRRALAVSIQNKDLITQIESAIRTLTESVSSRLFDVEQELYNKKLASKIEELTGYSIIDQSGNFIRFNDTGFLSKYANQLSQFDNPIFKAYRAILNETQHNTREKVNKLIQDVVSKDNELRNWMKANGKDEAWLVKSLIDTDPESQDADNLHSKLTSEFRKKIKDLRQSRDVDEITKIYEPSEKYAEYLAKEKVEKKAYFNKRYADSNTADLLYTRWLNHHDLTFFNGKPKHPDAWKKQLTRGKLKIKDSVIEANYSKEYNYIRSIPALNAYYDLFEKYNKEFRNILGVEYFNLPNNFLPNVRKSNIDRLLDNGIIKGTGEIVDNFMEELNVREDDMIFGEIDPETGALKKTIPKFFINPFKDKSGKLAVGEKSYDLTKSLIIFSKMAYNYEQMNQVEGVVLALRDFIAEKGEQIIKRGDSTMKDIVGNELASKMHGKDIEKIFQSFVDLYLYGVTVNPISDNSSGKYEKLILEAKQYFTLKSLGLGFIPAVGSFLAAKTQAAIEGFKGQVYTSEQYKKTMTFVHSERSKFHALYAFFDPMDVNYDFFSVDPTSKTGLGDPRERNVIKKYVNSRLLLRSFSAGDEFIDECILTSMAQNYYLDSDNKLRRMKHDEDRVTHKNRSIWALFKFDGENASFDISEAELKELKKDFRAAAQAAQSKIKGVIPEEDKAYWQTQIVGQVVMHFKSWMPGLLRERFGETKYNDALQLVEMGRFTAFRQELYDVDQLSIPVFMKDIVLPKVGQLLKHLVWYNGTKNNPRIRMSYENWLDNNPHYRGKISFDDFLLAQQSQMKALIIELRILLTMAMLVALLGADFDDDGKKFYQETWITRKLAAVLSKTNSEISFTYNPAEFAKMIKNPIPLAGLLTDAVNILANTYDETIDHTLGEKAPLPFHKPQKNDKAGAFYYSSKLIPGLGQGSKFFELFGNNNEAVAQ